MPSFLARPPVTAALDVNTTEDAVSGTMSLGVAGGPGCGVGMDALGSPIGAATIEPPLMQSGLTPKNASDHSTRSASFPPHRADQFDTP